MLQMFEKKDIFYKICVFLVYFSCFTFVAHRGYKCVEKYLAKPEGINIFHNYTFNIQSPSLTFYSNAIDENEPMKYSEWTSKCDISWSDYSKKMKWFSNKSTSCSDPLVLRARIGVDPKNLGISKFVVTTYDSSLTQEVIEDIFDEKYFNWESNLHPEHGGIHTMSFKNNLWSKGIDHVRNTLHFK